MIYREEVKLTKEQITEVVLKIIGNVQPIGKTEYDEVAIENLEVMGEVFKALFCEIETAEINLKCYEGSKIAIGKKAHKILEDTLSDYIYFYNEEHKEEEKW